MKLFRRRARRPRPLSNRRKGLYALLVALPILAILVFGNRGLLKRLELENDAARLRSQLHVDHAVKDSLQGEIRKVTSDTATIERLARERYGMVRAGETIYTVDE